MAASLGGPLLRSLRKSRRLTQADLAARSGVSQRSIRSVESGETQRPHPATLQSLATALELSDVQAAKFAQAFVAPVVADMADVLGVSPLALQERLHGLHEAAHAANWTSDVLHSHQMILPDGHFGLNRVHRVIRSTTDGLTHVTRLLAYDKAMAFLPRVADAYGASVSQRWLLDDLDLAVYEFALPRALLAGETHACGYNVDHSRPPEFRESHPPDTELFEGSRGQVGTFVLEMQFEASPPSLVVPFTSLGNLGERQRADPVRPDETSTVRLQLENTAPGQVLGFEWQW